MRRDSVFNTPDRGPFIPDAFLPAQDHRAGLTQRTPEQRLQLAVLHNALWEWETAVKGRAPVGRELEQWFASDDESYAFAFAAICAHTGLDASAIRRLLPALGKPPTQTMPVAIVSRAVREAYGWSMSHLSDRVGCDRGLIFLWEHGKRKNPTLAHWNKLWRLYQQRPGADAPQPSA